MIGIIIAEKHWNCLTSSRSQFDVSILDFQPAPKFRTAIALVDVFSYTQRTQPDNGRRCRCQRLFRTADFQLFANRANRALFDLSMTRNAGDLSEGRIQPNGVTTTLAIKDTTLFAKVTLQVDPFH